ncbi:MAG: 23S rRNA (adenine(2503)-C(2))-methyltransferase RlmN, partial [Dehalococcoidales bacterium]
MSVYLTDLDIAEVKQLVVSLGAPAFRAKQLLGWVYRKLAVSWDEMTDLPQAFRQKLAAAANLHTLTPVHEVKAKDGTVKVLFSLPDGKTVETALMKFVASASGRPVPKTGANRYTICVSTQVGCPIGCPFCATGQQGFERNLTAGEIIDQVLYFARRLQDKNNGPEGARVDNIVFMGMGEPLTNYDAVWQSIEMLNSPDGFGLSARSMTVSTSG